MKWKESIVPRSGSLGGGIVGIPPLPVSLSMSFKKYSEKSVKTIQSYARTNEI